MQTFPRFFRYVKSYFTLVFFAMICSLVIAVAELGYVKIVANTIDALKLIETHNFDNYNSLVIKFFEIENWFDGFRFEIENQKSAIRLIGGVLTTVLILVFVKGIFTYGNAFLMEQVGLKLIIRVRTEIFEKIVFAPIGLIKNQQSGDLIARMTDDVRSLNRAVSSLSSVVRAIIYIPVFVVGMLISSVGLTLIVVLIFPLLAHLINQFGKRIRSTSREIQQKTADLSSQFKEAITGLKIIKTFTSEMIERDRFNETSKLQYRIAMKRIRMTSLLSPLIELISTIGISIIFGVACWQVISGELKTGEFIGYVAMISLLFKPIRTLGQFNAVLQQSLASADRIFQILDFDQETESAEWIELPKISGSVEFRDASFSYEKGDAILKKINFTAEAGEMIALVGQSGGGKTTLLNLIPRFYEIDSGEILIDGKLISTVTRKSLRDGIAIVPQESILFSGTVTENILYGRRSATIDEVINAAKLANADQFIVDLPNGYDTEIGEGGMKLSGGQQQRLAIARAILKDPSILILDEATSSLDSESEALVQKSLNRLMRDRTTFVIAHRLSTVIDADQILVLQDGRIVERGTHDELIEKGKIYANLSKRQLR